MGNILDELLLGNKYLLYLVEHIIEGLCQLPDLILGFGRCNSKAHILCSDLTGCGDHVLERF